MLEQAKTFAPGYYWNHKAIYKDLERFRNFADQIKSKTKKDFEALKEYLDFHFERLHVHHHGEDVFFFPKIEEILPELKEIDSELKQEHQDVNAKFETVKANVENLKSLAAALNDYADTLEAHLKREEEKFLTTAQKGMTTEQYHAIEDEYVQQIDPKELMPHLPWMIGVMDEEGHKWIFEKLPPPVKEAYENKLKPMYEKLVKRL